MEKRYLFWTSFAVFFILVITCVSPFVLAEIEIEKEAIANTIIKEFSTPAVFNLTIKNKNIQTDYFKVDTQLDMTLQPMGSFKIEGNSEKNILLKAFFSEKAREQYTGSYAFAYYVKGQTTGRKDDSLTIKVVSLKNAVDIIVPESIGMHDKSLTITVDNKEKVILDLAVSIESELFEKEESIALIPDEEKDITVEIDPEKVWKEAGTYTVVITLGAEDYKLPITKSIELEPLIDIKTEEKKINLLFYQKTTITKTNIGNVPQTATVTLEKTSFAKGFTSFNTEPTSVEQQDNMLVHKWEKELGLGESLIVTSTTNFMLPLVLLLVVAGIASLYYHHKSRELVIRKKAVKAVTKTGEFVVKVALFVRNKGEEASNIEIVDRLPILATLHERFGAIKPDKIEPNRLIWHIDSLPKGEKRTFSYVVYSTVKVVGRLELPSAEALYTSKDKEKKTKSNRVYIIS